MLISIAMLLFTSHVHSLSTVASKLSTASIISSLDAAPLIRASDEKPISLPSLWRQNTPFGLADETAVVAFLRHFG